ncbi:MAG: hypothetical protein EXQ70_01830 [Solirubrobacterales bacterium]|nr:hypothetical protein [Solirubrobacterales bacterium]
MADDKKNKKKDEPTSEQEEAKPEQEKPAADEEKSAKEEPAAEKEKGKSEKEEPAAEKELAAAGGITQRLLKAPSGLRDRFRRSAKTEEEAPVKTGEKEETGEQVSTHKRLAIGIVAAVSFVLLLAVGAWAFDSSKEGQIANGVRVGGVDIGGRSAGDARGVIETKVVAPLKRPVFVTFDDQRFKLTSKEFKQTADVDGMVAAAQRASRDADLPSRVWREVTGSDVNVNLPPQVSYDEASIDKFVKDVADQVNRDPEDATVLPSGDSLSPAPGENGIAVRQAGLTRLVAQEVEDPVGARTVEAKVDQTKPEVTRADLAGQYPTYLTLDRANYTLRFFRNLKLEKTYTVAVGQVGLETPAGLYHIQDKQVDPTWNVPNSAWAGSLAGQSIPPGPGNPLIARWMGIFDGAGIHGTYETSSLGSAASHGCVRMGVDDVIDLYDRVDVGTSIYIG